jgi:hypothetical protein
MLYVRVTGKAEGRACTERGADCDVLGTSFAAPQVDFLISEIVKQRPDLRPDELKDLLFDNRLSPRQQLSAPVYGGTGPRTTTVSAPVLPDPYLNTSLQKALELAEARYGKRRALMAGSATRQMRFAPLQQLPEAEVGKEYKYWLCSPAPAMPAYFCGINATRDPTGGYTPYHFHHGSGGSFPPFGLRLQANGLLTGKPHAVTGGKSHTFNVCVTDLKADSICVPVTLPVKGLPPTPTPTRTPTAGPTAAPVYNYYSGSLALTVTIRGQTTGSSGVTFSSTETLSVNAAFSNVKVQSGGPQAFTAQSQNTTGTYRFTCSATDRGFSASTTEQGTVQGNIISPSVAMITGPTLPLNIILRYNMTQTSIDRTSYQGTRLGEPGGFCDRDYVPVPNPGQLAEGTTIDLVSSPASRTARWDTLTQFQPSGGGYLYLNPMSAAGGTATFTGQIHYPGRGQFPTSYTYDYSGTLTLRLDRTGP